MFKKSLLILLIGIISVQMVPLQFLSSFNSNERSEQLGSINETEEDSDDDLTEVFKLKLFDSNIQTFQLGNFISLNSIYDTLNIPDLRDLSYEIICPPPNKA